MVGKTRLMLRSRSVSTEHASHGTAGARRVNDVGPQRRAAECGPA